MGEQLSLVHHVEFRVGSQSSDIPCPHVRAVRKPEGQILPAQGRQSVRHRRVLPVGDDGPLRGDVGGKLPKGVLDILQVLEKVQMVRLDIQNQGDRGIEVQEGIAVFAGLHDDGVPLPHPVAGLQQRERAADHDGGVHLRRHEDMGNHGGGGGFPMGAGDADGTPVLHHNGAPGLGPLENRQASPSGLHHLRVIVVDSGGTHHKLRVLRQILRRVPDGYRNSQGAKPVHVGSLIHVGAPDDQAHAGEHLRQRGHGDPANTNQMTPPSGTHIFSKPIHQ